MKICICGSLSFADEIQEVAKMLHKLGHEAVMVDCLREGRALPEGRDYRAQVELVRTSDALLVCNFLKNCTPGYIGINSFAEMYAAHYFSKPIYTLFPVTEESFVADEMRSLDFETLNYDLTRLPFAEPARAVAEPAPVAPVSERAEPRVAEPAPAAPAPVVLAPAPAAPAPAAEAPAPVLTTLPPAPEPPLIAENQAELPILPPVQDLQQRENITNPAELAAPAAPDVAAAPQPSVFTPDADADEKSFRASAARIGKRLKNFAAFCSGKPQEQ